MAEKLGSVFGEKTQVEPNDYLVLDVETNGLSPEKDDLLCIALYDPATEKSQVRYLPLELQDEVVTTSINGITKEDLRGAAPLGQAEVDKVFARYSVEKRTILTYSGTGFDERFLRAYFSRHELFGLDGLVFKDIKKDIFSSYSPNISISKDNLCLAMGIEGVRNVHDALRDCILEWQIFKRMSGRCLLVTGDKLFAGSAEYIVPAGSLDSHRRLRARLDGLLPDIAVREEIAYMYRPARTLAEGIVRFSSNFTGRAFEELVFGMLGVKREENIELLIANKAKMEYLGRIPMVEGFRGVPLRHESDGRVIAVLERDRVLAKAITASNMAMKRCLGPVVEHLRALLGKEAVTQELVVDEKAGCLTLCDLSSPNCVIEIKTMPKFKAAKHKYQLYYQAVGRPVYVLSVDWPGYGYSLAQEVPTFLLRRIEFETAHRPPAKKATLVKYAVADWRSATRSDDISRCAQELGLCPADVAEQWLKCDPCGFASAPEREAPAFDKVFTWMKQNPDGTRFDCKEEVGLDRASVNRWWYAAGERAGLLARHGSPESIRVQLGCLSDRRNTWGVPAEDDLRTAYEEYREQRQMLLRGEADLDLSAMGRARRKLIKCEMDFVRGIGPGTKLLSVPVKEGVLFVQEGRTFLDAACISIGFSTARPYSKTKAAVAVSYKGATVVELTASKNRSDYSYFAEYAGKRAVRAFVEKKEGKTTLFLAF